MWRGYVESVIGARHRRSGAENQDAFATTRRVDSDAQVAIAIADGHGGAQFIRSRRGAEFAVNATIETLMEVVEVGDGSAGWSRSKRFATEHLPLRLVRRWQQAVSTDVARSPLTPDELRRIEALAGAKTRSAIANDPLLAYGTTILGALATTDCIVCVQLGDGDIVIVTDRGDAAQPFGRDPRFIANETTSLLSPNAWNELRVDFQAIAGAPPALILLATDGYGNSFKDQAEFLGVGPDLLRMLRSDGDENLQSDLRHWLEASAATAGDDVTLGLVVREDAIRSAFGPRSGAAGPTALAVADDERGADQPPPGADGRQLAALSPAGDASDPASDGVQELRPGVASGAADRSIARPPDGLDAAPADKTDRASDHDLSDVAGDSGRHEPPRRST